MQMVTLVFTDRHREQHTIESAERLCRDPEVSGWIVDALHRIECYKTACAALWTVNRKNREPPQ